MPKPKKKLEGVEAQTSVSDAARRTLEARLVFVAEMLDLAGREKGEDVPAEHVHQLRVATRRAVAAIDAFRPCLEKKSGKLKMKAQRMRKRLKRIRRAAGDARDCDVHLELFVSMSESVDEERRAALERLISAAASERAQAQKKIRRIRRELPRRKMLKLVDELLGAVSAPAQTDGEMSLIEHARSAAPTLARSVQEGAEADLSSLENLHELRIRLKRLRYAVEVFTPCFEKQARKSFHGLLKGIQDHLGAVNDMDAVIDRVERLLDDVGEGSDAALVSGLRLIADGQRFERDRRRDEFLAWWGGFDRSAFFDSLDRMLRPADGADEGVAAAPGDNGVTRPPEAIGSGDRPTLPTEREHST